MQAGPRKQLKDLVAVTEHALTTMAELRCFYKKA